MKEFPLKIVTPHSVIFDGMVQELVVRTLTGDVAILAGHMDYLAPLGEGRAMVRKEESLLFADCRGGMVHVKSGSVTLLPTAFTWKPTHSRLS